MSSVFALVERLAPHIEKELNLVIKSKEEAESLSSKLKKIQSGLHDAEREGVTNNAVKEWLKQLEDVAYEMDDVLDEWETLNLRVELEGASVDPSHFLDKARSLILSLCSCFKQVLGRREVIKKMKALSARIDNLLLPTERGKYKFVSGENSDRGKEFKQDPSTSLVNKLHVYGRDLVKDSLVEKLTSEGEEEEDGTQIVSIVGIGGVGKTTLAQLAYNDAEVDGFFIPKGWVSVSEPFDASAVAKAILEQFGGSCADAHDLETLVQRIKKAVKGKKFLLVLDNVWTEDGEKWRSLKNCLEGAKGSRILVTTRSESVARMMGTSQLQPLSLLSDLECGEILNGIALKGRRMEEREKLGGIGVEIAKKCNGLPLAATSVGSMLALKSSEEEWRSVLESPLWKYEDKVSNLFRLLNLSYIDLSPLLKRCFLSSIVLPKGALISIDEMIRIWMAYGYLNSKADYDQVRLKGLQYFNNLEMRSFFQEVESDGDIVSYKMHDILHDFANYLLRSEYSFVMDGGALCHLPWNSLGKLRTFCARNVYDQQELPLDALSHLKSVRLLSLCDCDLQLLPEGVGELAHLRYLDLSGNPISELPETVGNLYNLQTLGIENCEELSSLPEGIGKLINLRHLLNSGAYKLVEYPRGFEQLSGLWTLSEFRGSKLGCLGNLNQLQGSLHLDLSGLKETADSVEQVGKANLGNKKHIKELHLYYRRKAESIVDIVDALQPPPNLQTLEISSRSGKWLSHWIEKSFHNLKLVKFDGGLKCSNLPPFGRLPALEKLVVDSCRFKCLNTDFLGLGGDAANAGFPRLKKLRFINCYGWEEWEDIKEESFPPVMRCLEELEIHGCSQLKALPHSLLRQATSLKILKLSGEILYNRYHKFKGNDRDQISYVPEVRVNRGSWFSKLFLSFRASVEAESTDDDSFEAESTDDDCVD